MVSTVIINDISGNRTQEGSVLRTMTKASIRIILIEIKTKICFTSMTFSIQQTEQTLECKVIVVQLKVEWRFDHNHKT